MDQGPNIIEQAWTVLSFLLLVISLWQWKIARDDYRRKREEARYKNGNTYAASLLARWLSYTVALDCIVLFSWMLAGSLSIVRHYVDLDGIIPGITIVGLLYMALFSFGARVIVRAWSRVVINKME